MTRRKRVTGLTKTEKKVLRNIIKKAARKRTTYRRKRRY
jgi:hypothetical protein